MNHAPGGVNHAPGGVNHAPGGGDPMAVSGGASGSSRMILRQDALLRRLGIGPSARELTSRYLDASLPARDAVVLDAGCGRVSALVPFRSRIAELVGVDIHPPHEPLPWLDRFAVVDVCRDETAFAPGTFDTVLSSFTLEHFEDPLAALRVMGGWLRPEGWLVLATVNRAHPFVDAYLSLPRALAAPLQRMVKEHPEDAHGLYGACNTPSLVRGALIAAGYTEIEVLTTDHLARAWGRRTPTFVAGLLGDLGAHSFPQRRSTIVARAQRAD